MNTCITTIMTMVCEYLHHNDDHNGFEVEISGNDTANDNDIDGHMVLIINGHDKR